MITYRHAEGMDRLRNMEHSQIIPGRRVLPYMVQGPALPSLDLVVIYLFDADQMADPGRVTLFFFTTNIISDDQSLHMAVIYGVTNATQNLS